MRRYQAFPVPPGKNSLHYWPRAVSPLRVIFNFLVIQLCRYLPSFPLKNFLYRNFLGMKVGRDAAVGLMVMIDIFFPQEISIGENTIIGYNCTLLGHEFLQREWRRGPVQIGRDVMIGANTTVLPGVTIGDGAVVSACSLVNKDVPPGAVVGGVPIRILKN
ncbi:MAG TPA: acyltransferase [Firmicutes bacterium]|jgi:acetyltransferase-like isoleucine patch superfamily enzyme|nr:acyltransferase [Bacillota bacterium]